MTVSLGRTRRWNDLKASWERLESFAACSAVPGASPASWHGHSSAALPALPPALHAQPNVLPLPRCSCGFPWVLPALALPGSVCSAVPFASAVLPLRAPVHPEGSLFFLPLHLSLPCWISLSQPLSCFLYLCCLFPLFSSTPSCCPCAQPCPAEAFAACASSPSAGLFAELSLPPAHSTSDIMGLFFFFPLSCSFWLPRPLISFGVWEERRGEEGGGGEAASLRAFVRAKWPGRASALPQRRAARSRDRNGGIAVSGDTQPGRAGTPWLPASRAWAEERHFSPPFPLCCRRGGGREQHFWAKATGRGPALALGLSPRCAAVGRAGGSPGRGVGPAAAWSGTERHGTAGDAAAGPRGAGRGWSGATGSRDAAKGRATTQPRAAAPPGTPSGTNPTPDTLPAQPLTAPNPPRPFPHSRARWGSAHPGEPPATHTKPLPQPLPCTHASHPS